MQPSKALILRPSDLSRRYISRSGKASDIRNFPKPMTCQSIFSRFAAEPLLGFITVDWHAANRTKAKSAAPISLHRAIDVPRLFRKDSAAMTSIGLGRLFDFVMDVLGRILAILQAGDPCHLPQACAGK